MRSIFGAFKKVNKYRLLKVFMTKIRYYGIDVRSGYTKYIIFCLHNSVGSEINVTL